MSKLHVCDNQTEQEEMNKKFHGEASFVSWPVENRYGVFKPVKGWLCDECCVLLNARRLEYPIGRKQAHVRRRREVETEI